MKLHFKALLIVCLFSLVFTSCDNNEGVGNDPAQKQLTKKCLFKAANNGSVTPSTSDEDLDSECIASFNCFEYVFPIAFTNGNEETVVNDDDELYNYYESLDENADPQMSFPITIKYEDESAVISFKYPITVTLTDGTEKVVNNDEEFDALYIDCFGFEDYHDFEDFTCFEVQFPITAQSANGEIEINSVEDFDNYLVGLNEDEDPQFIFPINIIYSDGTIVAINSVEEMEAAFDDCFFNEDDDICFDITYPINLVKEEGSTDVTTVNNDEEFIALVDSCYITN